MKLTYIYHSGFVIEASDCIIVIDFFKDSVSRTKGIVHDLLCTTSKKIYVLVTHSHADHFNAEILEWKILNTGITYIFSKEIMDTKPVNDKSIIFLDKLQTYHDGNISVTAYGSTDIGGSFFIRCEDKSIFHAGDLNNWHWDEESTAEEINEAETAYMTEINMLSKQAGILDVVMFPIDPRLGKNYMKGAQQFIEKIKVNLFAPMHFGKNYTEANAFKIYAEKHGVKFFPIKEKGDSITF